MLSLDSSEDQRPGYCNNSDIDTRSAWWKWEHWSSDSGNSLSDSEYPTPNRKQKSVKTWYFWAKFHAESEFPDQMDLQKVQLFWYYIIFNWMKFSDGKCGEGKYSCLPIELPFYKNWWLNLTCAVDGLPWIKLSCLPQSKGQGLHCQHRKTPEQGFWKVVISHLNISDQNIYLCFWSIDMYLCHGLGKHIRGTNVYRK